MEESDKSADPKGVTSDEPGDAPQPAWDVASTVSLDLGKRFGQLIGRYKVVRVLGEGGMGTVFLAKQDKPTRLVALKVIRPGVASANLLRRFEYEAQVLGRLQHPGIAQIFEAGTADTGEGAQPYFVMEYVRGRSLMEYAQGSQLGTRQRLPLGLEAGHDLAGVHAEFDDLQRHPPHDRLPLLGHVDHAHAALANHLQELVGADLGAGRFEGRLVGGRCQITCRLVQKTGGVFMGGE